MTGDALRNTLDHLALDPNAGADRHYLVTVLRRLGYSEQEIERVLGKEGEPGRVIEVEYTGPSGPLGAADKGGSFMFGKLASGEAQLTFTVADEEGEPQKFMLAEDAEAGTETFEAVDLDDVDVSDDWGDWSDDADDAPTDADDLVEFHEGDLVEFKEKELVQFREKRMNLVPFTIGDSAGPGWTEVDPSEFEAEAAEPAEAADDTWAVDEAPADAWAPADEADVEWAEAEPTEETEPAEEPEELAWSDDESWAEPDDVEWSDEDDTPYTYEDYTLYTRPVELTTGKTQHIYFFARDPPKSGDACAMPEGYEVGVSEKTGLPFLRKATVAKQQCGALTEGNKQCRLSARDDSDYCHLHQEYEAPTEDELRARLDTVPRQGVDDTLPYEQGEGSQQCGAITQAGMQCRNTARHGSKYCSSHKGYHPHSARRDTDTVPVGRNVKDTLPSTSEGGRPKADDAWDTPAAADDAWADDAWADDTETESDDASLSEDSDATWADPAAGDEDIAWQEVAQPDDDTDEPWVEAPAEPTWTQPEPAVDEPDVSWDQPPAGTRVRVRRVAADTPEEAQRQVASEGGRVRSIVPIRIEEHEDD